MITIYDSINIWEAVAKGEKSRMDSDFIESIKRYGKSVLVCDTTSVSEAFILAKLCDSKGDFKRSMRGLYVDELPVTADGPLFPNTKLLRKGKNQVVAIQRVEEGVD